VVVIRDMTTRDARTVADLHFECINKGFLIRLGRRFLRQLYLGIAADAESRIWVAEADVDGGRSTSVVGFCAYSRNVAGLYKRVIKSRFLRLGLASLPYSLNPWIVKEVFDTLRYPAKQRAKSLPPAEILSIAVSDRVRGGGVGRKLLNAALGQARRDGVDAIKVLAGAKLEGANRFYLACGFTTADEIIQHGETLNVYVLHIDDAQRRE
jgi:GNAT superfamily N-acetyltransferase